MMIWNSKFNLLSVKTGDHSDTFFSEIELNNPEKVPRLKIVIWGQKQVFWDYICASARKMG